MGAMWRRPSSWLHGSLLAVALLPLSCASAPRDEAHDRAASEGTPTSTFSIVARDPETGDVGVAVASRFFGVGRVVPWTRAEVGAIATQSWANTTYGPRGLDALARGEAPRDVLASLLQSDPDARLRQVGIVDARGQVAAHTGDGCQPWAGDRQGEGYTVQGNLLVGPEVIERMAEAYETTRGDLATRLLAALEAGDEAGGDARGRQSAAISVARRGGGYAGFDDRYVLLHVEDHPDPIGELGRLLAIRFGRDPASEASRLARDGKIDRALERIRQGIEEYPAWEDLRWAEIDLLLRSGQKAAAAARAKERVEQRSDDDQTLHRAAAALAEAGRPDEARDLLVKLVHRFPAWEHVLRREIEADRNRWREALPHGLESLEKHAGE